MATKGRPSWIDFLLKSLRTELAVASIRSLLLNASSKVLFLLSSIVLARWLGADGYGIYASAIAVAMVLSIIAQLGLPTLAIRTFPVYEVKEQWGLLRGFLAQASKVLSISSLMLAGATMIIVWGLGQGLPDTQRVSLMWAAGLVAVAVLNSFSAAALRGLRHVVAGQLAEKIIIPALFMLLILGWWAFADYFQWSALSADSAVALRLVVTGIALLFGLWLLLRRLPPQVRNSTPEYDRKNWTRAAIPLFFLSGAAIVTSQTDVLMLVALQSNASAGIYQAAVRGAELVAFSLVVITGVVQPTVSRFYQLGDMNRLQVVVTAAARFALALALPVAFILAFFAEPILHIVYGLEFSRGAMSLTILCAAQVVNVSAGLVGQILVMTGHVRDAAIGMTVGAVVNVILNAILIPRWEIEGAAVATGISLVIWNIFLAARVRSRIGLVSGVFGARPGHTG